MPTDLTSKRPSARRATPTIRAAAAAVAADFAGRAGAALWARKDLSCAALLVAAATVCVSWNALMRQPRPHPYPMFGAAALPAPVSVPPARPKEVVATEAAPAMPAVPARPSSDAIGELLRPPAAAPAPPPPADAQADIAAAQRALTRLGYGKLATDGVMGAATRTAIERFQRDRKLPVTGELGPRTSRALSLKTGQRAG